MYIIKRYKNEKPNGLAMQTEDLLTANIYVIWLRNKCPQKKYTIEKI